MVPVAHKDTAASGMEMQRTSLDSVRHYLITSAAADFHKYGPHNITSFRNVKLGRLPHPDLKEMYFICGELLTAQGETKSEWVGFATIKTSGYEQYIGTQSKTISEDPAAKWETGDLSSMLLERLNSLRKEVK